MTQPIPADGLGSILRMTDPVGAVVHQYRYDAWGNLEGGSAQGGYAYTAREWDPEIGLYYYRARYYDPRVGRFISEDPIGFRGGVNFYAYVGGDPVARVDPSGLQPGQPFASPDEAVLDTLKWMKAEKLNLRVEHGGLVCHDPIDKCFRTTGPVTDNHPKHVDVDNAPCAGGEIKVGFYHNHPSGNPISPPDIHYAGDDPAFGVYTWRTGQEFGKGRFELWHPGDPVWNPDGSPYFGELIGTVPYP